MYMYIYIICRGPKGKTNIEATIMGYIGILGYIHIYRGYIIWRLLIVVMPRPRQIVRIGFLGVFYHGPFHIPKCKLLVSSKLRTSSRAHRKCRL